MGRAQLYLHPAQRYNRKAGQQEKQADVAQLVEQLIRNQQVVSSSLTVGSRFKQKTGRVTAWPLERERSFSFGGLFTGVPIAAKRAGAKKFGAPSHEIIVWRGPSE